MLELVITDSVTRGEYTLSPSWESAIAGWQQWLKVGGMSDATVRLRRDHIRCVARRSKTLHPRQVTIPLLFKVCDRRWSREHRKSVTSSLRSFCVWALDSGVLDVNPAAQLPKVRPPTPHPRPTPDAVWYQLLADAPPRERLIARLAAEAGLRRAEIACCHRDDLLEDGAGFALIIHGKGDRQRVVPLTDSLARTVIGHCEHGYLFPGGSPGTHLTPRWIGAMISHLMPPGWTLHTLRHRFASRGFAGTGNLRAVQEALGHASVATTQRYVAISSRDVRLVSEAAG